MKKARIGNLAALAFLLLCFALSFYYLIAGYGAYLDADMSSELALASHLAQEGTLLSGTWHYSTEVRVLNTQLVFTPLMALFPGNWRLVRTLGCMLLLGLMAVSAYACSRALGAKREYALMFAGLGVLPCSLVYAQMIVIGAYYIPHAVLTALLAALAAGFPACSQKALRGALMLLLAAVMGASSIRYLLCAALPMAAAGAYMLLFPRGDQLDLRSGEGTMAMASLAACAAGGCGYVLGQKLLARICLWDSVRYGASRLTPLTSTNIFDLLDQALDGLFKLTGYLEGRQLFSIQGLLSVGALGLIALSALLVVRTLRTAQGATRFGALMLTMSAALTLGTFLFVENLYLNRYWLPVMTLGAPVMAACLTAESNVRLRRLSIAAFACVVLGLSAVQIRDSMASSEIGADDLANVQAVEACGVPFGYATFWHANVLTELTDGRVEVVSIAIAENAQGEAYPQVSAWLESDKNVGMNHPQEKVFLLLEDAQAQQLAAYLAACGAQEAAMPGHGMRLFIVKSQQLFFETAQAMQGA